MCVSGYITKCISHWVLVIGTMEKHRQDKLDFRYLTHWLVVWKRAWNYAYDIIGTQNNVPSFLPLSTGSLLPFPSGLELRKLTWANKSVFRWTDMTVFCIVHLPKLDTLGAHWVIWVLRQGTSVLFKLPQIVSPVFFTVKKSLCSYS